MDAYLLDTCVTSPLFDVLDVDHSKVKRFVDTLPSTDIVYISPIAVMEMKYGLLLYGADEDRWRKVEREMSKFTIRPVDKHVANCCAEIRANLFRRHAPRDKRSKDKIAQVPVDKIILYVSGQELQLHENDLWALSIAVCQNLIFVTNDKMIALREAVKETHSYDKFRSV